MANRTTKVTPKELENVFKKQFPNYVRFAVANTLTAAAYKGMTNSEKWLHKKWITRNKFLLGGGPGKGAIKFKRAKPSHDLSTIWSAYGSPKNVGNKNFEFLEDQEEGFKAKGSIPTKKARTSKSYKKKIASKNKRKKQNILTLSSIRMALGKTWKPNLMVIRGLRLLHKRNFALPGSNQFFYMHDNQFLNFGAGLYQFSKRNIPNKLSKSGFNLQFPNVKKMFIAGSENDPDRKAAHWMKKSSLLLKQSEINKMFDKAADQAFTGQLKLWKVWR